MKLKQADADRIANLFNSIDVGGMMLRTAGEDFGKGICDLDQTIRNQQAWRQHVTNAEDALIAEFGITPVARRKA